MMQDQTKSRLPYVAAALSAVVFGFSFLFTKTALDDLDMFQLLGSRFFVAAVFMLVLRVTKRIKVEIAAAKVRGLLLVVLFQPILYFIFETIGVDRTSASESGVLIALIPVAVAIFAGLILKERLSFWQWLSIWASVAGVVLISLPRFQGGTGQLAGILALLGAVLAGALYQIFSKKASGKSSPVEVTYMMMWTGAWFFNLLGFLKAALASELSTYLAAFMGLDTLWAISYLGILSSVVAFFCMNYALSRLTPSKVAVFINLTPVISVMAGVFFRSESFAPVQILGAAVVLLGVWGVGQGNGERESGHPE